MGEAREIFLKACCEVAAAVESAGFRWRKSRQDTVKEVGDLKFRIWFQSSFRNALLHESSGPEQDSHAPLRSELFIPLELELAEIEKFGSVSFMPNVSVHAASIKKWRRTLAHPIRTDDGLAGTSVGYLVPDAHWLDVNLANPRTRDGRISAVIDLITKSGFQYFDRFRRPDEVVASLVSSSDPGMMDYMELEYSVCYGSLQDAYNVLQRYLRQWPECVDEYQEALRKYRRDGIPAALHGRPGPRLARMALALGIEEY
jgi:hypothetical protein